MRVLVLDGNQNQAVAAVRSLARAGHEVWAGESSSWSKAGWSQSCHETFQYPAPHRDPSAFVERIAEVARSGALVLPMTEATTLPLSAQREVLFASGARMVVPSHTDVLRAFDKQETIRLATSLGVSVPKTMVVTNSEEANQARDTLSFPVVLKPRSSEEVRSSGLMRTTGRPRYASDAKQYDAAWQDLNRRCSVVLVQEFVEGEGIGYFALMRNGELRADFAHRRIRDVHPTGSGSAVRVSVEPSPDMRAASLAILRALHWHGVAMVEFRHREGRPPVFMEVNGRFWNSLALACYAGVDFPALLARMAETGDLDSVPQYHTGVRCRWLLGDFRHLLEVWRGAPAGYPAPYPGRLSTLLAVLTPTPGTYHDLFQWRDPLPELGDWLNFGQRLTWTRSSARSTP
jgi:predicted ATP-grasp superfamily ATP-dependent carboligase